MKEGVEHTSTSLSLEKEKFFGPDLVTEAEGKVNLIRKNLEVAQTRQKSYHTREENPSSLKWEISYI
jgi:hypothetical protein